jgi:hypothetical protein
MLSAGDFQRSVRIIRNRIHCRFSGEMPYGEFQESTRATVRMTAALQPFIPESGALQQVVMAQMADQNAAAAGEFVGNLLGTALEILGDAADSGYGSHHHHSGGRHGGERHSYTRYR